MDVTDNIGLKNLLTALELDGVEPDTTDHNCIIDCRKSWRSLLLRQHLQPLTMAAIEHLDHDQRYSLLGNLYTSIAIRQEATNYVARAFVDMGAMLSFAVTDEIDRILDANAEQWLIDCEDAYIGDGNAD